MPKVTARRRSGYAHDVEIDGGHALVIDEPEETGGNDAGPSPTRTVAAALAACTAITVEMYAGRKEWDLGDVEAEVEMGYDERGVPNDFIVTLRVGAELTDEQLERIRVIAGKCPVHRLLSGESDVSITDRIEPLAA
jgi:putative redox protein